MPRKKTLKSAALSVSPKEKTQVVEPTIVAAAGAAAAQATTGEKIKAVATAEQKPAAAAAIDSIVQASGSATLGQAIEQAMAQAVRDTQAESEAIAAEAGDEANKQARIAVLNDPIAVQARMMTYREKALAAWHPQAPA
jgi:hypothetical protein